MGNQEKIKFEIGEICRCEKSSIFGEKEGFYLCKIIKIDKSGPYYKVILLEGNLRDVRTWKYGKQVRKLEEEDESLLSSLDSIGSL